MKKMILYILGRIARSRQYHVSSFSEQLTIETHLMRQLSIAEIDVVIDIGANIGQYATMLRSIGYAGEIISVEPSTRAFQALHRATAKDPKWSAYNVALGERVGETVLHVSQSEVFNSIHPSNAFGKQVFGESIGSIRTETVPMDRLDFFIDRHVDEFSKRRVFLKMDTQGYDHLIFAGTGKYRSRFSGLQSELSVCPIYHSVPSYIEMLALYKEAGYCVTGLYAVNRFRETGHVIEFDCVMVPNASA